MDLSRFPRRRYTLSPTPLEFMPNFTRALGGPQVWIKRDDMLGLFDWTPKFVRRYADLRRHVGDAIATYAADVRARRFPASAETYAFKKKA